MGGDNTVGFRKRLSRRLQGSFLLRRSASTSTSATDAPPPSTSEASKGVFHPPECQVSVESRRTFGREDSNNSRFSAASNHSISTASLQSDGNPNVNPNPNGNPNGSEGKEKARTRIKSSSNWFFSEGFCQPVYRPPKAVDLALDPRGIPVSTADMLVLKLWTITVKGFLYPKLSDFEKKWIQELPEDAQTSITELYKQITIFDYENADFHVETDTSHLPILDEAGADAPSYRLSTLTESTLSANAQSDAQQGSLSGASPKAAESGGSSSSPEANPKHGRKDAVKRSSSMSPRGGVSRQASGLERRALFVEKRSLSGRLAFPSSKVSRKSQQKANVLQAANLALKQYGITAVLCKHESHFIGGSIVLTYYIRLERNPVQAKQGFAVSALRNTLAA